MPDMHFDDNSFTMSFSEVPGGQNMDINVDDNNVHMTMQNQQGSFSEDMDLQNNNVNMNLNPGIIGAHENLSGRDDPNQHPMSAITGLTDAIADARSYAEEKASDALTEAESYADEKKSEAIAASGASLQEYIDEDVIRFTNINTSLGILANGQSLMQTAIEQNAQHILLKADTAYVNAEFEVQAAQIRSFIGSGSMLPTLYASEAAHGPRWTENGIKWTVNSDGSVTATGTATADSVFQLTDRDIVLDPESAHSFTGCPADGSASSYMMKVHADNDDYFLYGSSTITIPAGHESASASFIIKNGFVCPAGGLTFYPQFNEGNTALDYADTHGRSGVNMSEIRQQEDKIYLVVKRVNGVDVVDAASIVAAVNSAGSSVGISADKISLSGLVMLSSLLTEGTTTIDGSKITTRTLSADTINGGTITGVRFNNGSGTFTVDENGNVVANSFQSNNATITGGSIDMKGSAGWSAIYLETNNNPDVWSRMTPMGHYTGYNDSEAGMEGTGFDVAEVVNGTSHKRMELYADELAFYDVYGSKTAEYPASASNGVAYLGAATSSSSYNAVAIPYINKYRGFLLCAMRGQGVGVVASTYIPRSVAVTSVSDVTCCWVCFAQNTNYYGQCYFDYSNGAAYLKGSPYADSALYLYGIL